MSGIFTYIYHKESTIHVGIYTSPMDPMALAFGKSSVSNSTHHWVEMEHLIVADGRLYILYTHIPRTQMTSIFEGQPTKIRPFLIKARVIWVLGMQMFLY